MKDVPLVFALGLSVVVPVYNSEGTLDDLVARLEPVLRGLGNGFELILINDSSRDGSWGVITRLSKAHQWIRGINLMRNYGQHNALLCGIRMAAYDKIVTIDDDLQNPPEEIPGLVNGLVEGVDVIYGTPSQEQHGFLRDIASRITKLMLQQAMGADTARNVSAFRALRTGIREAFHDYRSPYVSIDVLLTWGTTKFASMPVRHEPRLIGKSNYTLGKLIAHALNLITGFSILPLQLAGLLGFAFSALGAIVLSYVLIRYLVNGSKVPGFAFLACIISIFSGAQMFGLGIMGEYLARMHLRAMGRPAYTIRNSAPQSDL